MNLNINLCDPQEIGDAIKILETLLNGNADGKATDTPEPKDIIPQEEPEAQEPEQISLFDDLDVLLETRGLSFGDCASKNIIACKELCGRIYDQIGYALFGLVLDIILEAYPTPGRKNRWCKTIILEISEFLRIFQDDNIDIDRVLSALKTEDPAEFTRECRNRPIYGEVLLEKYNYKLSGDKRMSHDKLEREGRRRQ